MKKIITALALCTVVLGLASCTRGGNIDRGNDGYIGDHDRHDGTTDVYETDNAERRFEDDIYNLPRDIRRGIDDVGDGIHDGLKNARNNIRRGLDDGGSTFDNRNVIK